MHSRLVVGCGSIGFAVAEALTERPGTLTVIDEREHRIERLREAGVKATHVDAVTADLLTDHARGVETIVVADDAPATNVETARLVAEADLDVHCFAYTGTEPTAEQVAALEAAADRVLDPQAVTTTFLVARAGDEGQQVRELRRALNELTEPLAIVTHDNPDPDAIASAVALQRIAESFGVEAGVYYYGRISHQENRAFVNLLDFELTRLESDAALDDFGGFALVDHSRAGVNDQLPADLPIDIVIDHHPPRGPVNAGFVDLRDEVGATSTLLVQYLQQFGIEIDEDVATGLLFGIRVDTDDFTREVSVADFEAAAAIVSQADVGTLERIESPSVTGDTFETIAAAITNRDQRGAVVSSCVGSLPDRDALAQAADRLLDLEGVNATMVYGINDGVIYISGRARGTDLDLGETLRSGFDQIGSAGGHADMAGAQIQVADTTLDPARRQPAESTTDAVSASGSGHDDSGTGEPATDRERPSLEDESAGDGDGSGTAEGNGQRNGTDDEDLDIDGDIERFIAERFFEALEARPTRETVDLHAGSGFGSERTEG